MIGSAPATEDATGFMRVWADFVASNSKIFSWISVLGLGFTTLYIVIGITYNLCKSYKIEPLIPLFISCFGIFILNVNPEELVYGMSLADLTYLDGKGIIIGLFVGIVTVFRNICDIQRNGNDIGSLDRRIDFTTGRSDG